MIIAKEAKEALKTEHPTSAFRSAFRTVVGAVAVTTAAALVLASCGRETRQKTPIPNGGYEVPVTSLKDAGAIMTFPLPDVYNSGAGVQLVVSSVNRIQAEVMVAYNTVPPYQLVAVPELSVESDGKKSTYVSRRYMPLGELYSVEIVSDGSGSIFIIYQGYEGGKQAFILDQTTNVAGLALNGSNVSCGVQLPVAGNNEVTVDSCSFQSGINVSTNNKVSVPFNKRTDATPFVSGTAQVSVSRNKDGGFSVRSSSA